MIDAFVHVIVEPSATTETAQTIAQGDQVEDAYLVTGEHDVVALLNLDSKDDVAAAVTEEIRSVSGVVETVTHVAFEP